MNYYYDIVLNFNEVNYMFYEWDEKDNLEVFKKIPFFQVNSKTLKDFVKNNVVVSKDFLNVIKEKSIKSGEDVYIALFADKNGAIALEFDEEGKSIFRSFLQMEDEENINEMLFTTTLEKIEYKVLEKVVFNKNIRLEEKIKLVINMEIKGLIEKNDISKLKYLYMEWFGKCEKDKNVMVNNMYDKLNQGINKDEVKIYNLIKLSYSNV